MIPGLGRHPHNGIVKALQHQLGFIHPRLGQEIDKIAAFVLLKQPAEIKRA
ncbi:hypothetical protein SDC9_187022 [bioreactor metagenome]|uniref:Uncharacterized protein n=1 Tax=bioreactor metagenome TaxID=1076179 RepID=A0A645HTL1_9ZZZZ